MTKITTELSKIWGVSWKDPWQGPCHAKGKLKQAPRRWMQSTKLHSMRFQKTTYGCKVESWTHRSKSGIIYETSRSKCMQRVCYDDTHHNLVRNRKCTLPHWWTHATFKKKKKKTRSLNQKFQNRVVPRGVSVQDDSGAYAVFTHKGPSVSEMTVFKSNGC